MALQINETESKKVSLNADLKTSDKTVIGNVTANLSNAEGEGLYLSINVYNTAEYMKDFASFKKDIESFMEKVFAKEKEILGGNE